MDGAEWPDNGVRPNNPNGKLFGWLKMYICSILVIWKMSIWMSNSAGASQTHTHKHISTKCEVEVTSTANSVQHSNVYALWYMMSYEQFLVCVCGSNSVYYICNATYVCDVTILVRLMLPAIQNEEESNRLILFANRYRHYRSTEPTFEVIADIQVVRHVPRPPNSHTHTQIHTITADSSRIRAVPQNNHITHWCAANTHTYTHAHAHMTKLLLCNIYYYMYSAV